MPAGNEEFGNDVPNPYRLFREIGEIKTRLDAVLANQEEFKAYTFEKVKKIDAAAEKLDDRVMKLEGSKGVIMGICIAFSLIIESLFHWAAEKLR